MGVCVWSGEGWGNICWRGRELKQNILQCASFQLKNNCEFITSIISQSLQKLQMKAAVSKQENVDEQSTKSFSYLGLLNQGLWDRTRLSQNTICTDSDNSTSSETKHYIRVMVAGGAALKGLEGKENKLSMPAVL